jgi:DNA-binding MarR family transcriptional regulator
MGALLWDRSRTRLREFARLDAAVALASVTRWALAERLTLHDLAVLVRLLEADRSAIKDVVADLSLPPSTVSRCLDRLEQRRLIQRRSQFHDRRAKWVEPTERVWEALEGS